MAYFFSVMRDGLQKNSVICDRYPLFPGLLLSASCRQISLGERELTTGSNCAGKQRYGVISKVQLSKKPAQ